MSRLSVRIKELKPSQSSDRKVTLLGSLTVTTQLYSKLEWLSYVIVTLCDNYITQPHLRRWLTTHCCITIRLCDHSTPYTTRQLYRDRKWVWLYKNSGVGKFSCINSTETVPQEKCRRLDRNQNLCFPSGGWNSTHRPLYRDSRAGASNTRRRHDELKMTPCHVCVGAPICACAIIDLPFSDSRVDNRKKQQNYHDMDDQGHMQTGAVSR